MRRRGVEEVTNDNINWPSSHMHLVTNINLNMN